MGLLKETLAHSCHRLFIFAHLLWDTNKHAKFRRQINVLAFLFDFEKRLVQTHNLFVVLLAEILNHRDGLACLALLKARGFWAHVPSYTANLVSLVVTITSHYDSVLEFIVDSLLHFHSFGRLACEFDTFLSESHHLLIYEF